MGVTWGKDERDFTIQTTDGREVANAIGLANARYAACELLGEIPTNRLDIVLEGTLWEWAEHGPHGVSIHGTTVHR